jgi:hypothetical protein
VNRLGLFSWEALSKLMPNSRALKRIDASSIKRTVHVVHDPSFCLDLFHLSSHKRTTPSA